RHRPAVSDQYARPVFLGCHLAEPGAEPAAAAVRSHRPADLRRVRRLRTVLLAVLHAAHGLRAVHHRLARPVVRDLPGGQLAAPGPLRPWGAAGRADRAVLPGSRRALAGRDRSAGRDGGRRTLAERLPALCLAAIEPGRRGWFLSRGFAWFSW